MDGRDEENQRGHRCGCPTAWGGLIPRQLALIAYSLPGACNLSCRSRQNEPATSRRSQARRAYCPALTVHYGIAPIAAEVVGNSTVAWARFVRYFAKRRYRPARMVVRDRAITEQLSFHGFGNQLLLAVPPWAGVSSGRRGYGPDSRRGCTLPRALVAKLGKKTPTSSRRGRDPQHP
jgi:hypothetical protein